MYLAMVSFYITQDIPNGQSTFIQYQELAGEFDMSLYISNSFMNSKDYDMLTNKIFSKINTSNGGLFQYIDLLEEGQKSIKTMQSGTITSIAPKTVQFGRRKVKMEVDLYGVKLTMGPIINK